jgi:hypothetical protein
MNIILGRENVQNVQDLYVVLELDTIRFADELEPITAYCIVENVPLLEMSNIDKYRDLHINLMRNFRLRNWNYCEDALSHLYGRWSGEVDTFYNDLSKRILQYKSQVLDDKWDGVVVKNRR